MRRLLIILVALGLLAVPPLFAAADDRSPDDFWVGPSFEGLGVRGDHESFFYGDCEPPPGEGGCAPPLEIQNATTCARNPSPSTCRLAASSTNGAAR